MVQPSSPGHAELRMTEENGLTSENHNDNSAAGCEQTGKTSNKEQSEIKDSSPVVENHVETDLLESTHNKRKEDEEETTGKKLKMDIDENFLQRNKMLNDCIEVMDCEESNGDQLQVQSEQLVSEIRALNELAREKEMEWNSILHLKKFKEELLMRIERKRQIAIINSDKPDVDETHDESRVKTGQSIMRLNISKSPQTDRMNKHVLLKAYNSEMNGSLDLRQNVRSRPTLDVQAIIADYRQRHPENVPRRGKRIRNSYMGTTRNSNVLNFSSTALGSGSQMKQNNLQDISNELNLILGAMDSVETSKGTLETSQRIQESASFKNMLLQLSRLSQNEKNELLQNAMKPPPPYPEVTVHPVTTDAPPKNSLLHGILTKTHSRGNSKKNFSPTLARLLTAPDQSGDNTEPSITNNSNHPSISEMLSSSKARNEITITPVETQFDKLDGTSKKVSNEDDGTEDSDDRLVIDESKRDGRRETDNSSEAGDEVPECQGCNQKTAQFVCAGCGNQWYCSRDCQVAAWDEHSEVCCG